MATMKGRTWTVNPWASYGLHKTGYNDPKKAIARIKNLAELGLGISTVVYVPAKNQVIIGMAEGEWKKKTCFEVVRKDRVTYWTVNAIKIEAAAKE